MKPMGDRQKNHGLLWMFRYDATGAKPREVAFDPSDPIYHLYKQTRNPYLVRAIAPGSRKLERTPEELHRLFRFFRKHNQYRMAPSNAESSYERRTLHHPPAPPTIQPKYLTPQRLGGDFARLPWMVNVFFQAVLTRLKNDPGVFKALVEELMAKFQEDQIRIKIYDAYQTFNDWNDLMDTMEEISRYPSPETFDLFCSALFAYYDLAYPAEER